jgi:tetraacyldisaccharide 4'-kinase
MPGDDAVQVRWAGGGMRAFAARFWRGELGPAGSLLSALLLPAEAAFRTGIALRSLAYDSHMFRSAQPERPVVSVGNLTVGGSGKTPFAAWLVTELVRHGARPAIVHGGYAGDEPALFRQWHGDLLVIIERNRVLAVQRAAAAGATVVVLDDGFQHRRLRRDLDIVLVAAESWTDRPRLLPVGPWREPPSALQRAHHIVITHHCTSRTRLVDVARNVTTHAAGKPITTVAILPGAWRVGGAECDAPDEPALAVAGIALPEQFVHSAQLAGARVAELFAFPDHHAYTAHDMEQIRDAARGRPIVTTEKDATKLAPLGIETKLWVLGQRIEIETGGEGLRAAIERLARAAR